MTFRNPVSPLAVTAALAPGSSVVTTAGSVTANTTAQQSAIDLAVIQGLAPAGVTYGAASGRYSFSTAQTIAAATTADILVPAATVQCVLRLLVLSCNVAGVQQWQLIERTPANAFVQYCQLALADLSKAPLLIPYASGLALAKGNKLSVTTPAAAGSYQVHCVYDAIVY